MPAHLRDRLTYANVVATLALFVALGGTGYAAARIDSGDIKNRTIRGVDVKRNTLTGTQIRESRLRRVPRARVADSAATAGTATRAGVANTANTANTANLAGLATNAQSLAGQGVGAFERSSRVQFARADATPNTQPDERVLLSFPAMGVQVRSTAVGCGANQLAFAVRNVNASGPALEIVDPATAASVSPNTTVERCGPDDQFEGEIADTAGRALFVDCFQADDEMRCLGIRSQP